jgi:hypothetical protein
MVMVVIFIVLFTALLGIVYRELAGAIRIETMHTLEVQRDTGSLVALAQALAALQTGTPSASQYYTTVATPTSSQNFIVTFIQGAGTIWTVQVSPPIPPGTELPAQQLPTCFGTPDVVP